MGKLTDQWIASIKHLLDNPPHTGMLEKGEHVDALSEIASYADEAADKAQAIEAAKVPYNPNDVYTRPAMSESSEVTDTGKTETETATPAAILPATPAAILPATPPGADEDDDLEESTPGADEEAEDDGDHEDLT